MFRRHAFWLGLAAWLLSDALASAQYSAFSPQPMPGGGYGRPGYLYFGNNAPSGGGMHHRHGHQGGGIKPVYSFHNPYALGIWGGGNPYINSYFGAGFSYASPGFYYGPSYYPPDFYTPPASYAPPPPASDSARLPPATRLPDPETNVAYIDLHVPASASVWAQGVPMDAKGSLRRFITPVLEPGASYSYEFRISIPENGKDVTLVRHISVAAGDRKSLTIFDTSASGNELPPPTRVQ